MPDFSDIGNFVNDLSGQAAAWYTGISGNRIVTPGTSVSLQVAQAAALQQGASLQAQYALANQNPTLAGLLSSPTLLLLIGGVLIVLLVFLFR